jgi:hypothetical protein
LRFFERATIAVLAVAMVATLARCVANDVQRVAASNATRASYYLSSSSEPSLATHTH